MTVYRHLTGVEHELELLRNVPVQVEVNVTRGALRAGARVIQLEATPLVPRRSGKLVETLRVSTRKRGRDVVATVKIGNPKAGVFYGPFVLGGTKPHAIRRRMRSALNFLGVVREVVQHPGQKPNPVLDIANARARDRALAATFDYADARLKKLYPGRVK